MVLIETASFGRKLVWFIGIFLRCLCLVLKFGTQTSHFDIFHLTSRDDILKQTLQDVINKLSRIMNLVRWQSLTVLHLVLPFLCQIYLLCAHDKLHRSGPASQRKYTRWSHHDAVVVKQYFRGWISGTKQSSLLQKADIMKFWQEHPEIDFEWTTIRNKVVNEKLAYTKRRKNRLESLEGWRCAAT